MFLNAVLMLYFTSFTKIYWGQVELDSKIIFSSFHFQTLFNLHRGHQVDGTETVLFVLDVTVVRYISLLSNILCSAFVISKCGFYWPIALQFIFTKEMFNIRATPVVQSKII